MRSIFTIHAGEFVFGETVLKKRPDLELWSPIKDKGVDILITKKLKNPISIQVKMTRDYRPLTNKSKFDQVSLSRGWRNLNREKLENSPADIWSLVLMSKDLREKPHFINICPKELSRKLDTVHGNDRTTVKVYPWVLKSGKAVISIDGQGLKAAEQKSLANDLLTGSELKLDSPERDFTKYLNNWVFLSEI